MALEKKQIRLRLVVEGEWFDWDQQFITGQEIKDLAGINTNKPIYLSLKDPWDDELIENDLKVDLAREGIEFFYVKNPLKFKIGNDQYDWNSQYITGLQLRQVGRLTDDQDIFLKIKGGFEDELVENNTKIDLARPGIENFVLSNRNYILIISGKEREWTKAEISFKEVIELRFGECIDDGKRSYSVTYSRGPKENISGSMISGDKVFVKNKMIFNVTPTDKS
ncbi:Multiubiquitin [Marivirga sericea]|uniref:Multiubiquitin n=1 Tax=Marivirga sericea TaxID=1028 RepID=A0A1X7KNE6_9BACT|nr:multiubiquitin domain-containing protein [Marivirga sericea]SMG42682.1 Multiubiquitin [Marivirga sericea]